MDGGDGGLKLVGADRAARQDGLDQGHAFGDGRRVPEAAILLGQRDQLAVWTGAGRPAGVGQQHQGQQAGDLAVVWQQVADDPRQPDRLAGQVGALQVGPGAGGCSPR